MGKKNEWKITMELKWIGKPKKGGEKHESELVLHQYWKQENTQVGQWRPVGCE